MSTRPRRTSTRRSSAAVAAKKLSDDATTITSGKRSSTASTTTAATNKKAKVEKEVPTNTTTTAGAPAEWNESECGTLLYFYPTTPSSTSTKNFFSTKVAGFDIDDTIIKTKSGKTFATNDLTDWQLWSNPHVKDTLTNLVSDGYRIVFFTNQEGISKGKVNKGQWKKKITNVIQELGLSGQVTVLASLSKKGNDYRKPHIGMWNFLCQHLSGGDDDEGIVPNASESMYVGDAAGRPKNGSKKKDFSCTDYKFALNIGNGMTFQTPEELFLNSKQKSDMASPETSNMGFQPKVHWSTYLATPFGDALDTTFDELVSSCCEKKNKNENEIIVIVGSPASGKSSMTGRLIQEITAADGDDDDFYARVNQDTLKTLPKCKKVAKEILEAGKSPIIDNTNRDGKTRKNYIDIAKSLKVPCRCVWIDATKEESFHLNAYRGASGNADGEKRSVPDMVIHSFYKNLIEPSTKEGYEEVIKLRFIPGPFDSDEHKTNFYRFAM